LNKSTRKWLTLLGPMLALVLVLAACGGGGGTISLVGTGATFPLPLYTSWLYAYNNLTPGVEVSYTGVGSSGGIAAITAGTVDFAGSDAIMTPEQEAAAEAAGGPILHIPMTSGAVAIIFNVPGFNSSGSINMSGPVLADIFGRNITSWDDPEITALNPALNSTSHNITVVHRSDGSGTNNMFTYYLCQVSPWWNATFGYGTSVSWATDTIGASKNQGVAQAVADNPYSIGYVELAYAMQNNLTYMAVQNFYSGHWILPSLESTSKAAENITLPDDMKIMLDNSPNPDAYGICGFTWVLAYVNQTDPAKGLALTNYLWWSIHDGQADTYSAALDYARLSNDAVVKAEAEIQSMVYSNGTQIHP
jgi:phosphate transport system substrate-binding protein